MKKGIKEDVEDYGFLFSCGIILAAGVAIGWNIVDRIFRVFRGRK